MRTLRTIAPLLLLLTACSPGGVTDQETDVVSFETAEPEAPYEDLEPVFFDHVRVVDPHDCVEDASFDPVTSVASLELGCPAGELDLSVGDVAVGKSDGGFALEVLDVTVVGNTVTVRGEPAPLSSMIASGGFGHTIDAFDQRSLFDLSGRTLVEEEVAGVPVRLDLTRARIDLDPRLKLGSEYDCEDEELVTDENCGDLVRSALYLELRANFLVEAYAEFEREASVSGVLELARLDEPFDFWLGPVPVVGVLRIELDATWKAGATGRIQGTALGAHVTGEMDLGGEWRRGEGWSLMAERTWDAELISPSMEAEASLEMSIGLRAKASVKLYSVAGPSFWAEPYASARADAHCEGIDWRAGAGVRAGAGLNLRLFDLLGWDDSVDREWHRDLASGTIETPIPALSANVTETLDLPAITEQGVRGVGDDEGRESDEVARGCRGAGEAAQAAVHGFVQAEGDRRGGLGDAARRGGSDAASGGAVQLSSDCVAQGEASGRASGAGAEKARTQAA